MPDYFLVEVKVSPSGQVKVFVDADHNASIDRLARINRDLYKRIDAAGLFGQDGNFSLEVSSPGLDEPLKLRRQYVKNVGRRVEVQLEDGTKREGVMDGVSVDTMTLSETTGKGKEKKTQQVQIPFNQIRSTKVCVVF
jgi:ribosome maturation factor RimP